MRGDGVELFRGGKAQCRSNLMSRGAHSEAFAKCLETSLAEVARNSWNGASGLLDYRRYHAMRTVSG